LPFFLTFSGVALCWKSPFFRCNDPVASPPSDDIVSLPLLRSFTHESPCDRYRLRLFDKLSLPSTCQVVLRVDITYYRTDPWLPDLPTPRDQSYLSDIRTVTIAAHLHVYDITFRIELVNPGHAGISFDRISYADKVPSVFSHEGFSDTLESIEIDSVETLYFDHYPVHARHPLFQTTTKHVIQGLRKFRNLKTLILAESNITFFLDEIPLCSTVDTVVLYSRHSTDRHTNGVDVLTRVRKFAVSRREAGTPLKALMILFPFAELCPSEVEQLVSCVGRVEAVSGDDALHWDVDEYLL